MDLVGFLASRWQAILQLTAEHLVIVVTAMAISVILGVVIGIAITFNRAAARIVLKFANLMMTIPSLALFALLIPVLGLGKASAIVGLVAYTQLPLIRTVYAGIMTIDSTIIVAARGMGLSDRTILFKIKVPLALPAVMAGIRTAAVMGIGIGAIAGYIGAGGLGVFIFQGINRTSDGMVLTGAIILSLIAILTDQVLGQVLGRVQRRFDP
ncbi:MAG: ABC transporter permease [Azospirillaceae bacterium]|nr:ABC transporter permease [Azospirillaceae bacterium]